MNSLIITSDRTYTNGGEQVRFHIDTGVLQVQRYNGGWVTVHSYGSPLGINEFRIIAEDDQLKVQQLLMFGNWTGAEGVDFTTVDSWLKI